MSKPVFDAADLGEIAAQLAEHVWTIRRTSTGGDSLQGLANALIVEAHEVGEVALGMGLVALMGHYRQGRASPALALLLNLYAIVEPGGERWTPSPSTPGEA